MLELDAPFFLTDRLAQYEQQRFCWYLKTMSDVTTSDSVHYGSFPPIFTHLKAGPLPSLDLSSELVADCELLVSVAAKAYLNRGMCAAKSIQQIDMIG